MKRHPYILALALLPGGCGILAGCGNGASSPVWLQDITREVGVDFVHDAGASGGLYLVEISGGGVALFDAEGDGDLDLYLVNGGPLADGLPAPGGSSVVNRLYRMDADGRFVDATQESGLGDPGYGMGVAVGDYDNDGDLDVYVTNLGADRLYQNLGGGTFADVTEQAGIEVEGMSCSATFFDFDADGHLDLYVTQYAIWDPTIECTTRAGQRDYCGPKSFIPQPDVLLRNQGNGTFANITRTSGIDSARAAGLGVVAGDFDLDGKQDLYVTNDAYANNLWINQGDGSFVDAAASMGVDLSSLGVAEAGMGVVAADWNDDGYEDFHVCHLLEETNTCYMSVGDGSGYADVTARLGLARTTQGLTGFGTVAPDLDCDGHRDLLVANGGVQLRDAFPGCKLSGDWLRMAQPNLVYRWEEAAGGFTIVDDGVDPFIAPVEISRGLAIGDLDADGDPDVVVTNIAGQARIYRNVAPRRGLWLRVRAWDPQLKRDALGARVTLVRGQERRYAVLRATESYLSSSEPVLTFTWVGVPHYDALVVQWVDGRRERFPGGGADREVRLERGQGEELK